VRKLFLIIIGLVLFGILPLQAQIQQAERARERRGALIRAGEERRERERQAEGVAGAAGASKARAAVMNVDVKAVFTRNEYKTFAEAQSNAVNRIADGDPLWLNIKFNGKLGDYVFALPDNEEPGKYRYVLYTEIGPQGDVTALTRFALRFAEADLSAGELKINLAPGIFGRNRSIPVLLKTADGARPGVWNNEFRITNSPSITRPPNDFLVKSPVVLDLSRTHTKYRQMWAEYDSVQLRGSPDVLKMPVAGSFFSAAIKKEVVDKLKTSAIIPAKFYFSGDDWGEIAGSVFSLQDPAFSAKKERRIFAAYTYEKFGSCLYGIAAVTQGYDEEASKFLTTSVDLTNDFPIHCGQLK
jgi:hypothetical protein